jgi:Saccharopine dehydrogenase and related proteins
LKVLVLGGAGDMGSGIVEALCNFKVDEILVGDISYARAENVSETFNKMFGCNTYPVKVDALSIESLRGATSGLDVVVNAVGPFYKYGYRIAENLIKLGLSFVDICDDHDATLMELNLDQDARRSGVTAVIGLGWTPGLSNILAKLGSRELGLPNSIDIYWVGSAADSRGLAVVMHLFHALIGEVPMFLDGRLVNVKAGGNGVYVEFPKPIGRVKLYYTGHPEPLTIPRYLNVENRVIVKGGLIPGWQTGFAKLLLRLLRVRTSSGVERLAKVIHGVEDLFRVGGLQLSGLRVDIEGSGRRISYITMDRMKRLTGLPAALGALLIAEGRLEFKGIRPPEGAIEDPALFIKKVEEAGLSILKFK